MIQSKAFRISKKHLDDQTIQRNFTWAISCIETIVTYAISIISAASMTIACSGSITWNFCKRKNEKWHWCLILTIKRSFNLNKKKSIYWSSHFRNIHHGINIFRHHRRCHDHCIQCSCCTELITCEVIRKLLKDMNSKKMLLWFMSA